MRTLRQAFTFFVKLTQHVQARPLLGERTLDGGEILFRFGELLLSFAEACLDIDSFALARFQ